MADTDLFDDEPAAGGDLDLFDSPAAGDADLFNDTPRPNPAAYNPPEGRGFWERAGDFAGDMIGGMVGTAGRAEIASDPNMGPLARAIESPVNVLTGMGETPMAQEAREIEAAGGKVPGLDPRFTEKIAGGVSRVLATGPIGPLAVGATEAGAKALDINQNEPEAYSDSPYGTAARVATAGIIPGASNKLAGAVIPAAARAFSNPATQFVAGTTAGAGADLALTEAQKGVEYLGSEEDPTLAGLGQALIPTKADLITLIPGAVAGGVGAARGIDAAKPKIAGIPDAPQEPVPATALPKSIDEIATPTQPEGQVIPDELPTTKAEGQTGGQIAPDSPSPEVIGQERPVIQKSGAAPVEAEDGGGAPADLPEGPIEKMVGSINTTKNAPDQQTGMAITEAYNANKEAIDKQRGVGDFPASTLKERAATHEWTEAKVDRLKPNQVLNDEQSYALDSATVGAVKEWRANKSSPELRARMNKFLKATSGVASAQGRALGSRNLEREAWLNSLEPQDRAIVNLQKFYGDKDIPQSILDKIADAKTDADVVSAIQHAATKKAGIGGQISGYRFFNMLSSPMTQSLNTVSNMASALSDVYERAAVAAADTVLPGKSATAKGEFGASMSGMGSGVSDGARKFLYVLKNGYSKRAAGALDPSEFRPQIAGGTYNPMNWPSRLLDATDEFFSSIAEGGELSALAHRKAYTELSDKFKGAELKQKVAARAADLIQDDLAIKASAEDAGKWRTHRETMDPITESFAKWSRESLSEKWGWLKGAPNPFGIAIPFVRVPYNVTKKMVANYSPVGLVNVALTGKSRGRAENIKLASQAAIGTATMAAIAPWVMNGDVTGAVPEDPAKREAFYESGKKPYSVKIGGRWIDYKSLGGLASPFIMASALWESYKEKQEEPDKNLSAAVLAKVGSYAVDSTYLAGLNGVINLLSDPESAKTDSTMATLLSQFVPAASLQRFINNTTAESVPETNSVTDRVIAGTVWQDQLPRRLNSLGQPLSRKGYFPSEDSGDPVYSELDRLGVYPSMPSKSIKLPGAAKSEKLTSDEYRETLKAGDPIYDLLRQQLATPTWSAVPDDQKRLVIDAIFKRGLSPIREKTRQVIGAKRLAGAVQR